MVGAAGIVASTINNRHLRRESHDAHRPSSANHNPHGHHPHQHIPHPPPHPPPAYTRSSQTPITTATATKEEIEDPPLKEQLKFYISLLFGVMASFCVFALLFLIPLVVEPSISTLLADFDDAAALCVTVDYTAATGLSKCGLWSSCREGCTSTPSQCHQIYVSYKKNKNVSVGVLDAREWLDESKWDVSYTQLLVNAKGCGYPPKVKCDEFGDTYGLQGHTYPCYYSRANPRLVVTHYNYRETAQPLLLALGLPTALFAISISILSFWYCPSCEERGKNKRPCRAFYQSARLNDNDSRVVVRQPSKYQRSPSLATISSHTTVSSVNSLDDGWQSPPSPPPPRHKQLTARARKL